MQLLQELLKNKLLDFLILGVYLSHSYFQTSPAKQKPEENEKELDTENVKPKGGLAAMFAAQTTKASSKSSSGATSSKVCICTFISLKHSSLFGCVF